MFGFNLLCLLSIPGFYFSVMLIHMIAPQTGSEDLPLQGASEAMQCGCGVTAAATA
jgi:hypothetical protein